MTSFWSVIFGFAFAFGLGLIAVFSKSLRGKGFDLSFRSREEKQRAKEHQARQKRDEL